MPEILPKLEKPKEEVTPGGIIKSVPDGFDFQNRREKVTFKDLESDKPAIAQEDVAKLPNDQRESLEYREKTGKWLRITERRGELPEGVAKEIVKRHTKMLEREDELAEVPPDEAEAVRLYEGVIDVKEVGSSEDYEQAKERLKKAKAKLKKPKKEKKVAAEEAKPKEEDKPVTPDAKEPDVKPEVADADKPEPPPTLHHLDEHPDVMSVEYIQTQCERSKFQGVLSHYYWEAKLKEAKDAEKQAAIKAEEEVRPAAVENLKAGKKEGWGKRFKESVKTAYQSAKETVKSKWPFWKERLKGTATAGALEYIHAEKFRRATRDVGKDTEIQSRLVGADEYVLFDSMSAKLKENGIIQEGQTWRDADKKHLETVSNEVLGERILTNKEIEDRIVTEAKEQLADRLKKYISTGGTKGLTPEKEAAIEARLREAIKGIRKNTAIDSAVDYAKLFRESFDAGENGFNKWKMRYVYGAVETALWLTGAAIIYSKLAGGAVGAPGIESLPQGPQLDAMDKNVWNTIKGIASNDYGISLNDQQLVELSKQAVSNPNNHIGVNIWNIPGNPMDTAMQQGHMLDLSSIREALSAMVR